jgi:hypothetical protein
MSEALNNFITYYNFWEHLRSITHVVNTSDTSLAGENSYDKTIPMGKLTAISQNQTKNTIVNVILAIHL